MKITRIRERCILISIGLNRFRDRVNLDGTIRVLVDVVGSNELSCELIQTSTLTTLMGILTGSHSSSRLFEPQHKLHEGSTGLSFERLGLVRASKQIAL